MTNNVKICSLNVRGLSDRKKRKDVFAWLKQKHFSIYCLQDIHVGPANETYFQQDWGYDVVLNTVSSESRGVAILFNPDLDYKIIHTSKDKSGNQLILELQLSEYIFTLIVIYGPNKDDPIFYENLKDKLKNNENKPLIICGDWNLVLNHSIDTVGYVRENNIQAKKKVVELIELFELIDPWRCSYPAARKYSWRSAKKPFQLSRLDFFIVSVDVYAKILKQNYKPGYRTDHSLVFIEIDLAKSVRGKGFWKLNVSLLHDKEYVDIVKREIQETVKDYSIQIEADTNNGPQYSISAQDMFEILKLRIRGRTIPYSKRKNKEKWQKQKLLEEKIEHLENELSKVVESSNTDSHIQQIMNQLVYEKEKLQLLRNQNLQAEVIRSKAQIYEQNEKPTRYFCNLEKKNYEIKLIKKLNIGNKIILDQKEILSEIQHFYEQLYSSRIKEDTTLQLQKFLNFQNIQALQKNSKKICEGPISEYEVKTILKDMKNLKSPGTDGFPAEFYKFFWPDIGKFLINSFNEAFNKGQLSLTQKQAIITLIPKGNKPREFLGNWRPLSLLNVDYKLLSGVLAKRLKTVLPEIISSEQKGFLKGRYIGENIRTVYDLMDFLSKQAKSNLLLLIDFQKAFDCLEWSYIIQVLEKYNFGSDFIRWFSILYTDANSCVINNGFFSEFF